jgi:hypothetical protein
MIFVAGRKDSHDVFHSSSQFIQNDIVILVRPNTEKLELSFYSVEKRIPLWFGIVIGRNLDI